VPPATAAISPTAAADSAAAAQLITGSIILYNYKEANYK
jgi:hypothetical protein